MLGVTPGESTLPATGTAADVAAPPMDAALRSMIDAVPRKYDLATPTEMPPSEMNEIAAARRMRVDERRRTGPTGRSARGRGRAATIAAVLMKGTANLDMT